MFFLACLIGRVSALGVETDLEHIALQVRVHLLRRVFSPGAVLNNLMHAVHDNSICSSSEGPSCLLVSGKKFKRPSPALDGILFPQRIADWDTLFSGGP